MNTQIALAGTIFVTFLWGSWFQTVKHTGNFPVHAFISMMYAVSVVIVWGAIGFLGAEMVPHGVLNEMTGNRPLALLVFACGLVFGAAMQLQLTVVKRIGLILSTSVSATCSILGGTAVSMMFAGCPPIPWRLLWACALHYGRKVLHPLPVWASGRRGVHRFFCLYLPLMEKGRELEGEERSSYGQASFPGNACSLLPLRGKCAACGFCACSQRGHCHGNGEQLSLLELYLGTGLRRIQGSIRENLPDAWIRDFHVSGRSRSAVP